ncbi:MAG: InlB B-repeat-containing protein [Methanomassiliicoccaceae archaeon]|jgi:uncharacterized repeat protein (TIGR02543 family)|nr:InlB B-repeat-containing protein [Methanomassiliicoccaceae archaeon]
MISVKTLVAIAVAAMMVTGGLAYFFLFTDKEPVVTLRSGGEVIGSVTVTKGASVESWLDEQTGMMTGSEGYHFAGWYTSASFNTAFYSPLPIEDDITLYAKWSPLTFDIIQTDITQTGASNKETCTFTYGLLLNDPSATFDWEIRDSYKTNNIPSNKATYPDAYVEFAGGMKDGGSYTIDLYPGRYNITLTMTDTTGTSILTKTMTVNGRISSSVEWNDYYQDPVADKDRKHKLSFGFDVKEYLLYAEKNRARDFKISNIGSFGVWQTDAIKEIANKLMALADDLGLEERYDRMNLIASFMNNALWVATYAERTNDSFYYKIRGVHTSNTSVEYYSYPTEALYDWALYKALGDCECHALLTASIAKAAGFESAIIVMTNPNVAEGHAVAGIKDASFSDTTVKGQAGAYLCIINGYYACETYRFKLALWVGNLESGFTESNGYKLKAYPLA